MFSPGLSILGSKGPLRQKSGSFERETGSLWNLNAYIDGRQLNDIIFDHSLIITKINFTNTLLYIHGNSSGMSIVNIYLSG